MSNQKSEKKIMEEKVAAVREVVHNVKKDEIILALYNFDLDVEATIRAFCEDGAAGALDEWVRPGGSNSKKNKKKTGSGNGSTPASAKPTPVVPASSASSTTTEVSNGGAPKINGTAPAPTKPKDAAPAVNGVPKQAPQQQEKPDVERKQVNGTGASTATGKDFESTVRAAFQDLRALLAEREAEVLGLRGDGLTFAVPQQSRDLLRGIGHVGGKQTPQQQKKAETPVKEAQLRHGTSHSSLGSSSLGDDSAIGQSSPLASEEPPRQVVAVKSGGMQMHSDALSEEQLADLQRQVQETLLAQGIDPSVLSGISTSSSAATQRRRGGGSERGGAGRGRGGRGGHGSNNRSAPPPELSILNNA